MRLEKYSGKYVADLPLIDEAKLEAQKTLGPLYDQSIAQLHSQQIARTGDLRARHYHNLLAGAKQHGIDIGSQTRLDAARAITAWRQFQSRAVIPTHDIISYVGNLIDPNNAGKASSKIISEMDVLFKYLGAKGEAGYHPVERAILAHVGIEAIQPLRVGNKRLGRMVADRILLDAGYAPILITPEDYRDYLLAINTASDSTHRARGFTNTGSSVFSVETSTKEIMCAKDEFTPFATFAGEHILTGLVSLLK